MLEKVGIVSLGCAKNRVDTEIMLGFLKENRYEITNDPNEAEIIIVNTCGFIGSAKEESIDTILEMAKNKITGSCKMLIVTGCLSERYKNELPDELPEVDAFIGVNDYPSIIEIINKINYEKQVLSFSNPHDDETTASRVLTTPGYTAYVKIAEGCDNYCSYCVIPKIRGTYKSRKIEDILFEIQMLADQGVKEVILIAQDTTRYGEDIYQTSMLPTLIEKICLISGIIWVRILYSYPERVKDDLLQVMNREPKVCKYLDIPIQHIDDTILGRMNRKNNAQDIEQLLNKIKELSTDFMIRSTMIVGFPGEDIESFYHLKSFVEKGYFDHLGIFTYSQEEGTPAAGFCNQIPEHIKQERSDLLMKAQRIVSNKKNQEKIGSTYDVLIEGIDNTNIYIGRAYFNAPEIDGKIYINTEKNLEIGEFYQVYIKKAHDYDLVGEIKNESCQ